MGTRVFQTVMKFHCQGGGITRENDEKDREIKCSREGEGRKTHTHTHAHT